MSASFKSPFLRFCILSAAVSMAALPSSAVSKKETEQAGAALYHDKGCAYCHGDKGQGTNKGPSLSHLRKEWKAPRIAAQIENGGQKMPSFKDSVSEAEIGQLVAYLRSKHGPAASSK